MARNRAANANPASSSDGVHVGIEQLMALQHRATSIHFLPRQPIHSLLSGRHASRMRGRGLNFEELRHYLPGDDVRTIDWRVTARTREPHVRVYSEERERPALLVVDQRISMFYGTTLNMKSVTAAELAAAGAWRVLGASDRVGAVIFDDEASVEIRPHRSRSTVMRILNALVEKNNALRADSSVRSNPPMLNRVLEGVARIARHDFLVVIISDFDGIDDETTRLVTRLSRHNDVLAIPVFDPSSSRIPEVGHLVVSDGELQFELELAKAGTRRRLGEMVDQRLSRVMGWQPKLGVPVIPISSGADSLEQLRDLMGRTGAKRRRV